MVSRLRAALPLVRSLGIAESNRLLAQFRCQSGIGAAHQQRGAGAIVDIDLPQLIAEFGLSQR
jgi:hypothetical protein